MTSLIGLGYEIDEVPRDAQDIGTDVVVNCLGLSALRVMARIGSSTSQPRRLFLVDDPNSPLASRPLSETITVPNSYRALTSAIQRYAKKTATKTIPATRGSATVSQELNALA